MYEVEFYRDRNGKSEIVEYLDGLKETRRQEKRLRVKYSRLEQK
jgi:hypothetical protein